MKLLHYTITLLFFMITAFHGHAQDQKLYSFSLKQTGQVLTYSQNTLVMADARTGANQLSQLFIIKRLTVGKALIASAANPEYFLMRSGAAVILAPYVNADAGFEWDIQYSGYPYASFTEPGTSSVMNWQSGSGFSMQNAGPGLTHNDDTAGDSYRFGISNVTNTF